MNICFSPATTSSPRGARATGQDETLDAIWSPPPFALETARVPKSPCLAHPSHGNHHAAHDALGSSLAPVAVQQRSIERRGAFRHSPMSHFEIVMPEGRRTWVNSNRH